MSRSSRRVAIAAVVSVLSFTAGDALPGHRVPAGPAGAAPGSLHIIAVGIDHYGFFKFKFCKDDARAIAGQFSDGGRKLHDKVSVHLLLDEAATRAKLLEALEQVAKSARPQDTFIFAFAGVALAPDDAPNDFRILLSGARSYDERDANLVLTVPELRGWLGKIEAQNQLIALDGGDVGATFQQLASAVDGSDSVLAGLTRRRLTVLGIEGYPLEDDALKHGVLTYAMLRALGGEAELGNPGNGVISVWELEAAVARIGLEASRGRQHFRTFSVGGDFPLLRAPESSARGVKPEVPLDEPAAAGPGRRDRALLIATDVYDAFPPLDNPVFDARAVRVELQTRFGFEVELLENPSYLDIRRALIRYQNEAYSPRDQLLIFFAGHGDFDVASATGMVIARDSSNEESRERQFGQPLLNKLIDNIPCQHVMLVLDCCFAGTWLDKIARRGNPPVARRTMTQKEIDERLRYFSRRFLGSVGKRLADDGEKGSHSPFARALLGALRGPTTVGAITYADLLHRLDPVRPVSGAFGTDEPDGDFLFIQSP